MNGLVNQDKNTWYNILEKGLQGKSNPHNKAAEAAKIMVIYTHILQGQKNDDRIDAVIEKAKMGLNFPFLSGVKLRNNSFKELKDQSGSKK